MSDQPGEDGSGTARMPSTLTGVVRCFFRHASPRILLVALLVALGYRLTLADWTWVDLGLVVAVMAAWPVQEWLIHVHILHFKPKKLAGRTIDLLVAKIHRQHHEDPWSPKLVFVPLHVFLGLPFFVALVLWVAPTRALGLTFLSIYLLLGLHYEWVHLLVHTRYKPRSWNYQRLWRNHRLHHFKNEAYWFGVSMLSGDRILGTAPDKASVATSATARNLLGQEEQ